MYNNMRQMAEGSSFQRSLQWDFKTNNTLDGIYQGHKIITIKNGPQAGKEGTIHHVEVQGHGLVSFFGNIVLNKALLGLPPGRHVWITYQGKVPTKAGFMVDSYYVEHDPEMNGKVHPIEDAPLADNLAEFKESIEQEGEKAIQDLPF